MLIKDWTVQAQWDDSKIAGGLRKLEQSFNKINKSKEKATKVTHREKAERKHQAALGTALARDIKIRRQAQIQENRLKKVANTAAEKSEDRRLEAQKRFMSNLRKQSRILQRQARSLEGTKGSGAQLQDIRGQRSRLAQMRTGALSGGFTLAGMGDLNRSLGNLAEKARLSGKRVNDLTQKMTLQRKVANGLRDSVGNLARSYVSAFAAIAAVVGTYRIGEELEQIQSSLLAVSGSSQQAGKDWEYIQGQALRLGTDLKVMSKGFQQIGTAGKAMGFSIGEVKNIFLGAAESAKAFNLSTDDSAGVMRAFTQIMSKGVVSMEELKSQLGDRMPVAMSIAAKSMNMTMDVFIKKVSDGQIQSRDFIRGYADELRTYVRTTGALAASLDSVRTARNRVGLLFDIGVFEGFKEAGNGLKMFFTSTGEMIKNNLGGFRVLGETVGLFFKALTIGLEVLTPVLAAVTGTLEHFRQLMDDAFNADKASSEISIVADAVRHLGVLGLYVTGYLLLAFESLTKGVNALVGKNDSSGLTAIQDIFSVWAAGSILVWLGKLLSKFLGISAVIKAIAGAASKVTSKAGGAAAARKGSAGGMAKSIGAKTILGRLGLYGAIAAAGLELSSLADEYSWKANEALFGDRRKISEMLSDSFTSRTQTTAQSLNINVSGKVIGAETETTVNGFSTIDEMKIGG